MAWLDNIRNAMHPYDDDYIENEERAAEDEFSRQEDDIPADESFEDKQPRPVFSRREPKQQPSYSAPAQEKQKIARLFVRRSLRSGRQGHARFRAGVYNRADQCRSRRRCGRRF